MRLALANDKEYSVDSKDCVLAVLGEYEFGINKSTRAFRRSAEADSPLRVL
jgi:hypothetical protein